MFHHYITHSVRMHRHGSKTRRGSRNKRKTTRRMRRYNKGGAPKVDPTSKKSESEKKKDEVKIMAHSLVPAAADTQLSFTPAARNSLLLGAHAEHMLRHLGISTKSKTHHHDPLSATQAPLEGARARVMVNTMIDAIHANVDRLRARGDFANARVQLDRALELGSIRARVELADMLYGGRTGAMSSVDVDYHMAHVLVDVDDPVLETIRIAWGYGCSLNLTTAVRAMMIWSDCAMMLSKVLRQIVNTVCLH